MAVSPRRRAVLILAAGQGKRLKSSLPKVLHPIYEKPLLSYVLDAAKNLGTPTAVLGHGADVLRAAFPKLRTILQARQLGTGHALLCALPAIRAYQTVLVLSGDTPLVRSATLRRLLKKFEKTGAAAALLTTVMEDPYGYGRILRGKKGRFTGIAEEKDASPSQKRISEVNAGTYVFRVDALKNALRYLTRKNAQKEYYLTELFPILIKEGKSVTTLCIADWTEALGVNSRADLAEATDLLRLRKIRELLQKGVSIIDPMSVHAGPEVRVGSDSVLAPLSCLLGRTRIGKNCRIGQGAVIRNCRIGQGAVIHPYSVLDDSIVGADCSVGPFARLRPGTRLGKNVKIGNFVETKKTRLGDGTKAGHLSYLGDALIGRNVNVGAGTITCNYDGKRKHVTVLEDGVFVGSDTQLVAPVRIGRGAYLGAGSTITKDVPPEALALSRARQLVKAGWARRRKKRRTRKT